MSATSAAEPGLRARLGAFVEGPRFTAAITALILVNAVTLGLETSPAAMQAAGGVLLAIDRAILAVFVVELLLRMYAHGLRFFRGPWNWFDLIIVGIALLPATGPLSVLRALRILRVLRLVSVVPQMRSVVESVVRSLPGLGSIALLLLVFFYVFAVLATKLFGAAHPAWFGGLPASMFTLFQVMTLENWGTVAREVMATHPWSWVFFLSFILVATFTVLNLFIAVIVNAMQEQHARQVREGLAEPSPAERLEAEVRSLRAEIAGLREALARESGSPRA